EDGERASVTESGRIREIHVGGETARGSNSAQIRQKISIAFAGVEELAAGLFCHVRCQRLDPGASAAIPEDVSSVRNIGPAGQRVGGAAVIGEEGRGARGAENLQVAGARKRLNRAI